MFKFIKSIFTHINNVVLSFFEKVVPASTTVRGALRKVENAITSLSRQKNELDRNSTKLKEQSREMLQKFEKMDSGFKFMAKKGDMPTEAEVQLALNYKKLADVLAKRSNSCLEQINACDRAICDLGRTRSELNAKLELCKFSDTARKYDMDSVADIKYNTEEIRIDVEEIINNSGRASEINEEQVTNVEVAEYLESLKG
ncbi:hypothetical protein [Proteus mirabilis]|uniref:hypothetical protein n=1 Tax=Proteus mirabilis TaxID=584 RepID=UPI0034D6C91C